MKPFYWLSLFVVGAGCVDTGQERAVVPLFVAGVDVSEPFDSVGGVPVMLERADLAFGPLYLCAGATAGDLCDTARLEWLESIVVDTADPDPARAGELTGVTGPVRSWMYDLGISSQLVRSDPFALEAARELGGVSLVIEGRARVSDANDLPFRASIAVQQEEATELGIPVVRKSGSDDFGRTVRADERGLLVRFDPRPWLQNVDFRAYAADETCADRGEGIVCSHDIEQTCGSDGSTIASRDCEELGQRCVPDLGCVDEVILEPETQAFRSVRNELSSGRRPAFHWDYVP